MPNYNYECQECLEKANIRHADLVSEYGHLPLELLEQEVLFETFHSMNPTEEELLEACKCPRCESTNCQKIFHDMHVHSYTRGYGFLDKAGCHRDMNRFKLQQEDPYKQYRESGEADHLNSKLEKGGKFDPKTKYFVNNSSNIKET